VPRSEKIGFGGLFRGKASPGIKDVKKRKDAYQESLRRTEATSEENLGRTHRKVLLFEKTDVLHRTVRDLESCIGAALGGD